MGTSEGARKRWDGRPPGEFLQRLHSRIVKRGPDECWEWSACKDQDGYGLIKRNNQQVRATRVVWELTHGQPPGDLQVLHSCDNPPCCNPAHLFLGTAVKRVVKRVNWGHVQ